jgi:hypothetical protein
MGLRVGYLTDEEFMGTGANAGGTINDDEFLGKGSGLLSDDEFLGKPDVAPSTGVGGDIARTLASGAANTYLGLHEVARRMPGVGLMTQATDAATQWATGHDFDADVKEFAKRANESVTPEQGAADQKHWVNLTDGPDGSIHIGLGKAWSDPRSYLRMAGESAPAMLVSMGPGALMARGTYFAALAKGEAQDVAAKLAAKTAAYAGMVSEGLVSGGQSGVSTRDEVNALPLETLRKSEAFQNLVKQGLTEDQARKALAEDASTKAFFLTGVTTGIFGGFGDHALAKIIGEGISGGIFKRILSGTVRGIAGEELEEVPQNVSQQIAENYAVQNAEPKRGLFQGVGEAFGQGLAGGLMGGPLGAVGGVASEAESAGGPGGEPAGEEGAAAGGTPPSSAAAPSNLTPGDIASPIPNEVISRGKQLIDEAIAGGRAIAGPPADTIDQQVTAEIDKLGQQTAAPASAEPLGLPPPPAAAEASPAAPPAAEAGPSIDLASATGLETDAHAGRPAAIESAAQLEAAGQRVNTEPTPAQAESGNYKKAHISVAGLDITVENPKGSTRRGTDANGKAWEAELPAHYGYVKGTTGSDGDHVDVFVGDNPSSAKVYVVDQIDPSTGKFDEHKAMLGFNSEAEARAAYEKAFSDGKGAARIGAVTEMNTLGFKGWLKNGNTAEPLSYVAKPPQGNETAEKIADRFPRNQRRTRLLQTYKT